MTIQTEITRLTTAKADLKTAIANKGVTVPDTATIDDYAVYVGQIESGASYKDDFKAVIERMVTNVTLPDDLTRIGNYAFQGCTNLALTSLPNGIISLGNYAFANCSNINLISLPSGVTSIGNYAFHSCTNLALTSLPNGIISLGSYAFNRCTNLALTTLPSGVTSIGVYAFHSCSKLVNLSIPCNPTIGGSNTSNGAFLNCIGLKSVTIGAKGKPMTIDKLPYFVFTGCTNLTSITVYTAGAARLSTAPFGAENATVSYLAS